MSNGGGIIDNAMILENSGNPEKDDKGVERNAMMIKE